MLAVLLHTRRGLSRVAALRAYAWCSLTTGRVLTRAGCNKRSIRKKGAAVEAVLRVSRLAPLAAYLVSIEKWWGPWNVCSGPHPFEGCCGGVLLSHNPSVAVPSALPGLASRFGMLLGVSPVL